MHARTQVQVQAHEQQLAAAGSDRATDGETQVSLQPHARRRWVGAHRRIGGSHTHMTRLTTGDPSLLV